MARSGIFLAAAIAALALCGSLAQEDDDLLAEASKLHSAIHQSIHSDDTEHVLDDLSVRAMVRETPQQKAMRLHQECTTETGVCQTKHEQCKADHTPLQKKLADLKKETDKYRRGCRPKPCKWDTANKAAIPMLEGMRRCQARGEPHFETFDGATYLFAGVGNYVLVKTPTLEVQARIAGKGCCFYSFAVKITDPDGKSYTMETKRSGSRWYFYLGRSSWNGVPTKVGMCSRTWKWSQPKGKWADNWNTDLSASSRYYNAVEDYMGNVVLMTHRTVQIFLKPNIRSQGMCGNNDGDKSNDFVNGHDSMSKFDLSKIVPSVYPTDVYKFWKTYAREQDKCDSALSHWAHSWRCNPGDKYHKPIWVVNPTYQLVKTACKPVPDCTPERLVLATSECTKFNGGADGSKKFRDCLIDICLTGDARWAKIEINEAKREALLRVGGAKERPARGGCSEIKSRYKDSKTGTYWLDDGRRVYQATCRF